MSILLFINKIIQPELFILTQQILLHLIVTNHEFNAYKIAQIRMYT